MGCLIFLSCYSRPGGDIQPLVITAKDSLDDARKMERAFVAISEAKTSVRTGDLVLRTGNDFTSEGLKSLNRRNQDFSHCGIASIENDSVFVYHALGGEWNPDQKIRRDPLELFAEPYSNRGIALYRFSLPDSTIKSVLQTVGQYYHSGIMFDMQFDLASDDRMYCAEFVYKCFHNGTRGQMEFNISHIGKFAFIGVDDLFLHPQCRELQRIVYK